MVCGVSILHLLSLMIEKIATQEIFVRGGLHIVASTKEQKDQINCLNSLCRAHTDQYKLKQQLKNIIWHHRTILK